MSNQQTAPAPLPLLAVPCCPPVTRAALSQSDAEVMAGMFKALGDPVRLRLFSNIASAEGGEACVCDIQDVGVSQPTVSHHLRKACAKRAFSSPSGAGAWVYYQVAPDVLAAMARLLAPAGR